MVAFLLDEIVFLQIFDDLIRGVFGRQVGAVQIQFRVFQIPIVPQV